VLVLHKFSRELTSETQTTSHEIVWYFKQVALTTHDKVWRS